MLTLSLSDVSSFLETKIWYLYLFAVSSKTSTRYSWVALMTQNSLALVDVATVSYLRKSMALCLSAIPMVLG